MGLQASGATDLLMAHVNTDTIHLVGRWRNDAMLSYLHTTEQTFTGGLTERMVQHGDYVLNMHLAAVFKVNKWSTIRSAEFTAELRAATTII